MSPYHFIHYTSTIFPHPLYKIVLLVPKTIHKTGTPYFTYNPLSGYHVSNKRQKIWGFSRHGIWSWQKALLTTWQHNSTPNLSTAKDSLTYHMTLEYIIPKDKLKYRQSYHLRSYCISPLQLHSRPAITKFSNCSFEGVDIFLKNYIINSNPKMINLGKNLIFCSYS